MKQISLKESNRTDYFTTEAYRSLSTNLRFCGSDVKVIALTSCMPNEGKSTISLELAKSLANTGKKTLLIDADLRHSVMAIKYTDARGVFGLSQLLSGQIAFDEALYHTQYENFDLIFSGQYPPNPVELLSGASFSKMIEHARSQYDYVLIDTPPLGLVIDCAVLAAACDGAIVVINEGTIPRKQALEVKRQLERSGVKILGAVLNHVESKGGMTFGKKSDGPMNYGKYYGKT